MYLISIPFKRDSLLMQFLKVLTYNVKPDSLCQDFSGLGLDSLALDLELALNS